MPLLSSQTFTKEHEALLDSLYNKAMERVFGSDGHGPKEPWNEKEVTKHMTWFRDAIIEDKDFEILLATSPKNAQKVARDYTGEDIFFQPLVYPWFSDLRFVYRFKFGEHIEHEGKPLLHDMPDEVELNKKYDALLASGIYNVLAVENDKTKKKALIVSPMFSHVSTDETGRLHSTEGAAVAWRDGYKEYAILGLFFDEDVWQKIVEKKLTWKEITEWKNIDEKAAILSVYGTEWLIKESKAECIEEGKLTPKEKAEGKFYTWPESDVYKLYIVRDIFPDEEYFVSYIDPSTGRQYFEAVPPEEGKKGVFAAMGWRFHTDGDSFKNMEYHA